MSTRRPSSFGSAMLFALTLPAAAPVAQSQVAPAPAEKASSAAYEPRRVLIAPFENVSGTRAIIEYEVATSGDPDNPVRRFRVDRYSHGPRIDLETILVNLQDDTFEVIERQRVDQMLQEQAFGSFSGMVDESTAMRLGQVLGANTIVMGSIVKLHADVKEFSGYGVRTATVRVTGRINIRAIDMATMKIVAAKAFDVAETFPRSNFGGAGDTDVAQRIIDAAMKQVAADEKFLQMLKGTKPTAANAPVEVRFEPKPDGCDVLVDGEYVGTAPLKLSLPSDVSVQITIERPGYESWSRSMKPRAGMVVAPVLVEKASNGK